MADLRILWCRHPETGELIIEQFRDVKDFEGRYKVSNFGRVFSLPRWRPSPRNSGYYQKGKLLKLHASTEGYHIASLSKDGKYKTRLIHQMVAEAFLGHVRCGYKVVVDHKDFDRTNNRAYNLRLVTPRQNGDLKHIPHSSQYTGVSWFAKNKKWRAHITKGPNTYYLGQFNSEHEAHLAYQNVLNHYERDTTNSVIKS